MDAAQPPSSRGTGTRTESAAPPQLPRLQRARSSPALSASSSPRPQQQQQLTSLCRRLPARSRYASHDASSRGGAVLSDDDARHAAPDLDSSDVPSPSRTAALADVDLYGRLNAHWDFKWTSERLAQLERDEALARKLQEQEDLEYAARLQKAEASAAPSFAHGERRQQMQADFALAAKLSALEERAYLHSKSRSNSVTPTTRSRSATVAQQDLRARSRSLTADRGKLQQRSVRARSATAGQVPFTPHSELSSSDVDDADDDVVVIGVRVGSAATTVSSTSAANFASDPANSGSRVNIPPMDAEKPPTATHMRGRSSPPALSSALQFDSPPPAYDDCDSGPRSQHVAPASAHHRLGTGRPPLIDTSTERSVDSVAKVVGSKQFGQASDGNRDRDGNVAADQHPSDRVDSAPDPTVMVLTSTEVPTGFTPPPALDYTRRFGGSVHRALSEIRAGRVRIPSAAFASAAFAAAVPAPAVSKSGEAIPLLGRLEKSSSSWSVASTLSVESGGSARSLLSSTSDVEPNVTVSGVVPDEGGFQTAFACSGGHVFVEGFITASSVGTPRHSPSRTSGAVAAKTDGEAYGRQMGLREGDVIVGVNGVRCIGSTSATPEDPGLNSSGIEEAGGNATEGAVEADGGYKNWETFRTTLLAVVAKGPGTAVEFNVHRPPGSSGGDVQVGGGDVTAAALDQLPSVADTAQTGCIFVCSRRLSRQAGEDVFFQLRYMSLENAAALAARIKAADLATAAEPSSNRGESSAAANAAEHPAASALPPKKVAPHSEKSLPPDDVSAGLPEAQPVAHHRHQETQLLVNSDAGVPPQGDVCHGGLPDPCTLSELVDHMTSQEFEDTSGVFVTTFFRTCWCFASSKDVLEQFVSRCRSDDMPFPRSPALADGHCAAKEAHNQPPPIARNEALMQPSHGQGSGVGVGSRQGLDTHEDDPAKPHEDQNLIEVAPKLDGPINTDECPMTPAQMKAVQALQFWCQLLRTGHANSDLHFNAETRSEVRQYVEEHILAQSAEASPRKTVASDVSLAPTSGNLPTTPGSPGVLNDTPCERALRNIGRQLVQAIDNLTPNPNGDGTSRRSNPVIPNPARRSCLDYRTPLMVRLCTPRAVRLQTTRRIYDWAAEQVAVQITLSEYFYYFFGLSFRELENVGWTRPATKSLTSPTVLEMIDLFNKRVFWIVKEVIDDFDAATTNSENVEGEPDRENEDRAYVGVDSESKSQATDLIEVSMTKLRGLSFSSERPVTPKPSSKLRAASTVFHNSGSNKEGIDNPRPWYRSRVARVQYFIEVALVLRQLGNYYGLFEVMLALTDPYVSRLRWTWTQVDRYHMAAFAELKALTSSAANYKQYRHHFARHAALELPRIPALHIVLRDLATMEYASSGNSRASRASSQDDSNMDTSELPVDDEDVKSEAGTMCRPATAADTTQRTIMFSKYMADSAYVEEVLAPKMDCYRLDPTDAASAKLAGDSLGSPADGSVTATADDASGRELQPVSNDSRQSRTTTDDSGSDTDAAHFRPGTEGAESENAIPSSLRRTRSDTGLLKLQEGLICPRCKSVQQSMASLVEHAETCSGSWVPVDDNDVALLGDESSGVRRRSMSYNSMSSYTSKSSPSTPSVSLKGRKRFFEASQSRAAKEKERSIRERVERLSKLAFFGQKQERPRASSCGRKPSFFGRDVHVQNCVVEDGYFSHDYDLQTFLANQVVNTISRADLWTMAKRLQREEHENFAREKAGLAATASPGHR